MKQILLITMLSTALFGAGPDAEMRQLQLARASLSDAKEVEECTCRVITTLQQLSDLCKAEKSAFIAQCRKLIAKEEQTRTSISKSIQVILEIEEGSEESKLIEHIYRTIKIVAEGGERIARKEMETILEFLQTGLSRVIEMLCLRKDNAAVIVAALSETIEKKEAEIFSGIRRDFYAIAAKLYKKAGTAKEKDSAPFYSKRYLSS